jgi:GAF domain-containing protein
MSMLNPEQINNIRFDYQRWRERFLRVILYVSASMGLIAILLYIFTSGNLIYDITACVMYFILLFFTFLKMPHIVRAGFFLVLIYIVSISALLDTALSSGASMFFLGWVAMAALIVSPAAGWIATGISLATLAAAGWLFLSGNAIPWTINTNIGNVGLWAQTGIYTLLLASVIVRGINLIQKEFIEAEKRSDAAFQSLRQEQANLANRIAEATSELSQRTTELEAANRFSARRAIQFEAISEVASSIGSIRSMDKLLPRVTELISEQFGFYHVGIFLKDADNQFAILMAANSPGGKKMLNRNHKLRIGEQGIVGYVTQTGLPRVALNVGEDAVFFNNPDLPDTHSEMALPLFLGGQTIGALDVQSTEDAAFDQEDVRTLTVLANQIGLAIENARLFEQTSRSLAEAESLSRQYVREGWRRLDEEINLTGFQFTDRGLIPSPVEKKPKQSPRSTASLEVPIVLRGQTIGSLVVRSREKKQLTPNQVDIVKAVAERVALSAENARLFEETSRRAERERTVSQITTNIRSNTDPQTMLETALSELKRVLGTDSIEVRPYNPSEPAKQRGSAGNKKSQKLAG